MNLLQHLIRPNDQHPVLPDIPKDREKNQNASHASPPYRLSVKDSHGFK